MMFGVINEPMSLLYTDFSIIIGSVYLFLPTMIMTLVGVLENIDDDLLEAAATLGLKSVKRLLQDYLATIATRDDCRKYSRVYRNAYCIYHSTIIRWK